MKKTAAIFALSGFLVNMEYTTRFLLQDHESGAASTMIIHLLRRGVTPAPVTRLFSLCARTRPKEEVSPSDTPEQ